MSRVVVADDHVIFRQGLIKLLEHAGHEVLAECSTGEEAVAAVRRLQPEVAILDVTMPGRDGISAARELAGDDPAPKIIMLTMHDAPEICSRAVDAGAIGYILKDDAFNELESAMISALRGEQYVSSSVRDGLALIGQKGVPVLSKREEEVVRNVSLGLSNKQIGEKMCISPKTVDVHRTNIMKKLGVHSSAELVRYAFKAGLV